MGKVIDIEPRLLLEKMRLGLLTDSRTLEMARAFVSHTEVEVFQQRMTLQNPKASPQDVSNAIEVLPVLEFLLRNRKHCLLLVEDEMTCGGPPM
jgi:hypothetical protein